MEIHKEKISRSKFDPMALPASYPSENITGFDGIDPEKPIFSIGTAANILEVHPRTLKIYEKEGLIKPFTRAGRRYFSINDIQWIACLRNMIHDHGISIASVKRILMFTSCHEIVGCPEAKRKRCMAFGSPTEH